MILFCLKFCWVGLLDFKRFCLMQLLSTSDSSNVAAYLCNCCPFLCQTPISLSNAHSIVAVLFCWQHPVQILLLISIIATNYRRRNPFLLSLPIFVGCTQFLVQLQLHTAVNAIHLRFFNPHLSLQATSVVTIHFFRRYSHP